MMRMCIGNNEPIQSNLQGGFKEGSCDIKKYFELIRTEIERCKDITKKLLLLSRPVSVKTDIVNVDKSVDPKFADRN